MSNVNVKTLFLKPVGIANYKNKCIKTDSLCQVATYTIFSSTYQTNFVSSQIDHKKTHRTNAYSTTSNLVSTPSFLSSLPHPARRIRWLIEGTKKNEVGISQCPTPFIFITKRGAICKPTWDCVLLPISLFLIWSRVFGHKT